MVRVSHDDSTAAVRVVAQWPTWWGPARAEAQVPDLKTHTPQVMAVIESRRTRYPEVAAALARVASARTTRACWRRGQGRGIRRP